MTEYGQFTEKIKMYQLNQGSIIRPHYPYPGSHGIKKGESLRFPLTQKLHSGFTFCDDVWDGDAVSRLSLNPLSRLMLKYRLCLQARLQNRFVQLRMKI
jgi:hypothetical protein